MTYKEILVVRLPEANNFTLDMITENLCPDDVFGSNVQCPKSLKCEPKICWEQSCACRELKNYIKIDKRRKRK